MEYIFNHHKRILFLYGVISAVILYYVIISHPELALDKLNTLKMYSQNLYSTTRTIVLFFSVCISLLQPIITVLFTSVFFWCASVFLNKEYSYNFFVKTISISYFIIFLWTGIKLFIFLRTGSFQWNDSFFKVDNPTIDILLSTFSPIDLIFYLFTGWIIFKSKKEDKWFSLFLLAFFLQFLVAFFFFIISLLMNNF